MCNNSGWANGNWGKYVPGGGIRLPFIVAGGGGGIVGCVPGDVVNGLKSVGMVGGNVVGIGDPEKR